SLRGGPDVRSYRNVWKMNTNLTCLNKTNDCDDLVSQGCSYDSTICNNESCTDRIFKYKCGGTGAIKEYEKSVVCAGNLRCMGTECKEVIKVESGDFGEAAAAGELLNMVRIDSGQGSVFPGDKYECQSAPKNCCDESVSGVSIGDYIAAGRALYTVGSAAAEAYAPAFYQGVEAAISYIPGMGTTLVENAAGELVEQSLGQATQELATDALASVLEEAGGMTASAAADAAAAVIGAICTVLWVLAILYALYTIFKFLFKLMFSCDEDDMSTSVKLTLKLCHQVGEVDDTTLGMKLKKKAVYCCFNSILARVIHEQGRPQVNRGWGTPELPDCSGFAFSEIQRLDFSKIDLSEYMQYVTANVKTMTDEEQAALIQKATNSDNKLKSQ
ncbi:MAG: conjugal transfer protein TraN, partial [Smithella sp.]